MKNLNERPDNVGSAESRLSPDFANDGLNRRLGPRLPRPLIRAESTDAGNDVARRRRIGLASRFEKDRG
jgi:hypothetical protein